MRDPVIALRVAAAEVLHDAEHYDGPSHVAPDLLVDTSTQRASGSKRAIDCHRRHTRSVNHTQDSTYA